MALTPPARAFLGCSNIVLRAFGEFVVLFSLILVLEQYLKERLARKQATITVFTYPLEFVKFRVRLIRRLVAPGLAHALRISRRPTRP